VSATNRFVTRSFDIAIYGSMSTHLPDCAENGGLLEHPRDLSRVIIELL